jgi:hypothetical protein
MVVLLVEAAPLAQTPEPAQDDSIEAIRIRANAGVANVYIGDRITYPPFLCFGSCEGLVEQSLWNTRSPWNLSHNQRGTRG